MKLRHRVATLLSLTSLSGALLCASVALASPQERDTEEADSTSDEGTGDEAPRELTPEERAKIKEELERELKESLQQELERRVDAEVDAKVRARVKAELEAAEAREAAARATAEQKAAAEAAAAAKKAEDERNPLVPPWQDDLLGKHRIDNDENTYKPGTGMHLESEDGKFALTTRLRAQMRQEILSETSGGESELSQVFQIRRARLQFKGHTFNEHNKMKVELAFSPRDLGVRDGQVRRTPLLTWYFEFDYLRDLTLRMGQYKIPYSRQRVVSSGDLQLVDRSLANGEFNEDRDIGFDLRSKDLFGLGGYLRYYAGVYMGEGRDFGDRNATADFKLHYLGRLEVLPMGDFKDYKEADIERNLTPKLSLGGAYSFHHDAQRDRGVLGSTPDDGGTTNYHSFNVDYAFKWYGFSSTGEFHWRKGDRAPGGAMIMDPTDPTLAVLAPVSAARNGYGLHVQAGYLFPRTAIEIAARYSGVRGNGTQDPGDLATDTDGFTSLGREDSVGGGLSYYFAGHPWKLQTDFFHSWKDGDQGESEDLFRLQLQLAY